MSYKITGFYLWLEFSHLACYHINLNKQNCDTFLIRKLDKEVNGEPEWVQGDLDAKLDNGWTIPVSKVGTYLILYKNYFIAFSIEIVSHLS